MDYKISDRPAFNAIGKSIRVSTKDGGNIPAISQFWGECMGDGTLDRLTTSRANDVVCGQAILGMCSDFATDMSEFTYTIAVEAGPENASVEFPSVAIPALTWAQFAAHGAVPDVIGPLWENIMGDFLENSPYRHGSGPDVEVYPSGDPMAQGYSFEVWVPVVKK